MTDDSPPPDRVRAGAERGAVVIPRWVKVFVLVALVVALALLAHMIIGGGSHGPALHGSATMDHAGMGQAGMRVATS